MKITQADIDSLNTVAAKLKIPPEWLQASINFETAGTFDPLIKNPLSSARGLIQFTNAAAVNLGFKDSLDLVSQYPTVASQLRGPVYNYFKEFAPFTTKQDFIFSVFLPKYRRAALDTVIFHDDPLRQQNFRKANPGIQTVGDYLIKLEKSFARVGGKITPTVTAAALLAFAVLGYTAYKFFQSGTA